MSERTGPDYGHVSEDHSPEEIAHAVEQLTPSIRRTFMGGEESVTFNDWATNVIQDYDVAADIARAMLGGHDPYSYNEAEPQFFERFTVEDADALREQLAAEEGA